MDTINDINFVLLNIQFVQRWIVLFFLIWSQWHNCNLTSTRKIQLKIQRI